jgi:hypothetical protein
MLLHGFVVLTYDFLVYCQYCDTLVVCNEERCGRSPRFIIIYSAYFIQALHVFGQWAFLSSMATTHEAKWTYFNQTPNYDECQPFTTQSTGFFGTCPSTACRKCCHRGSDTSNFAV